MYWRVFLNNISLKVVLVGEFGLPNQEYSSIDHVTQGNDSYEKGYSCAGSCFKLSLILVPEPQRLSKSIDLSEIVLKGFFFASCHFRFLF